MTVDTGVPEPEPTEVAPTAEQTVENDSLAAMVRSLPKEATPTAPTPPVAEPPPAPAPTPSLEPTPPAAPAPVPEPPKIKLPEIPPAPVVQAPTPARDNFKFDTSTFSDEEIDELNIAIFAEKTQPHLYTGHAQKTYSYIKQHQEMLNKLRQEEPETDISESERYKRFKATAQPKYKGVDRRKFDRQMALEAAKEEFEKKLAEMEARTQNEIRKVQAIPKINATAKEFVSELDKMMPEQDDGLSKQIVSGVRNYAENAVNEFLLVSAQLKTFSPSDPVHKFLADFVEEQGQLFLSSKSPNLKRGRKNFATRSQYNQMSSTEQDKHFTFSDEEIVQMLAYEARRFAENEIQKKRKELEEAGYTRAPRAPAVVPPAPPVVEQSPRVAAPAVQPPVSVPPARQTDPFLAFLNKGK